MGTAGRSIIISKSIRKKSKTLNQASQLQIRKPKIFQPKKSKRKAQRKYRLIYLKH